jgi:hypothetical protein
MRVCRPRPLNCRLSPLAKKQNLADLVKGFRREHAPGGRLEYEYFQYLNSIDQVIHHVAFAIDERGRCYDHQFRIWRIARIKAKAILASSVRKLRHCTSFHELHNVLEALLLPIRGIGELYVSDVALRLGAHLGLARKFVYLHAGTRQGAGSLGVGYGRAYLEMHELPRPLQSLTPDEIESFLCIYKTFL